MNLSPERDLNKKPTTKQQLDLIIKTWIYRNKYINNPTPSSSSSPIEYKFKLNKILPLPDKLFTELIKYICYVMFNHSISDLMEMDRVKMSLQLKEIYSEQFYHGKWRKQFNFQFSVIYLIKIISSFIGDYFPSLQINQNLQSQFFIIIMNLFIGNEIGTKIYHLITKKYIEADQMKIKHKNNGILNKKKDSFATISKSSLSDMGHVVNSSAGQKEKIVVRLNKLHKNSIIKTQIPYHLSLQIFNQELKKGLHVDPLPVILPKKLDINQFQREKLNEKNVVLADKLKSCQNMKDILLKTNKITSSMQTSLALKNQNSLSEMKKPTKITISRQHNSNHYSYSQNEMNQLSKIQQSDKQNNRIKSHYQNKRTNKMDLDSWRKLVKKIKFASKNSPMFEKQTIQSKSMENRFIKDKKETQFSYNKLLDDMKAYKKIKTQNTEYLTIDVCEPHTISQHQSTKNLNNNPNKTQNSSPLQLLTRSQSTQKIQPSSSQQTFNPVNRFEKIRQTSNIMKIKLKKLDFLTDCQKRNQIMHYSMFNFKKTSYKKTL